jgi:hypothetical protein
LVGGEMRRAAALVRGDWIENGVDDACIDAGAESALAQAWLEDARLEHASIASFARFTLELLALGAPADLIADAQRATGDEVDHARRCFTLASRYAGQPLGPGPLGIEGQVLRSTLVDIAMSAVREGCVGETLAALQASAQLESASDARVRDVLAVIAADEARHAELAWRFVHWAIETGGAAVRTAVAGAFQETLAEIASDGAPAPSRGGVDAALWRAHGRLSPREERKCRTAAAREVIEPCARALLSHAARRSENRPALLGC